MGIGMAFVTWPDADVARQEELEYIKVHGHGVFEPTNIYQVECEQMALNLKDLLYVCIVCHVICGILNIYREIFETKLGTIGQVMRATELLCIAASLSLIIMATSIFFDFIVIVDNPQPDKLRKCLSDREIREKWTGTSIEWLIMEITVWVSFLSTMAILMIKSRFTKVGIDQSK